MGDVTRQNSDVAFALVQAIKGMDLVRPACSTDIATAQNRGS